MKHRSAVPIACRTFRRAVLLGLGAALFLTVISPAAAQKKKKKNPEPAATTPIIPMSDEAQIDYMISEMLGAWQIGDIDKLHKDYADDVSVVNGDWAPPVIGWNNFLAAYQQQRARMQQVRLDRSNTYIRVAGTVAWACYQWDFSATVDGRPLQAWGQTTLVMEKRDNRWVIVHNHTSQVQTPNSPAPANTPATTQPKPG